MKERIRQALREMGISFDEITHVPAHTMEECAAPAAVLHAVIPANLFLRPRRQETYYLLLAHPTSRLNTSVVSRQAGSSRLSFASEDELLTRLHAPSGSASPMGLLFEEAEDVTVLMDRKLKELPRLGFHLCDNTATLAMSGQDFVHVFLPRMGKTPIWIDMEG